MATTYHNALQQLYVAYFNRPADYAGLNYWEGILEANGGNTAVVSATFAQSAEYKAEYAGMSNAQAVNQIYMNLFNRAAEPDGLAYWAGLLNAGTITIDTVVADVAAAAIRNNGTDAAAVNAKVAVATAFTNALNTTAEQTGYNGELANEAAKALLSTIKTAADATAAVVPAKLDASVAAVVKAATPFTVQSGLAALEVATDARTAFLVEADGDDDAETSADAGDVAQAVIDANTALNSIDVAYATAKPSVQAALIAAEVEELAEALEAKQTAYDKALEEAGDVDGLVDAIANLAAAKEEQKTVVAAETTASANLAAALASFNVRNATQQATLDVDTDGVGADVADGTAKYDKAGVPTDLIVLKDGELVLATGVKEADFPGVTALLNASKALEAAEVNTAAAAEAVANAEFVVNLLDLTAGAPVTAALKDVGGGMTLVEPADDEAPTPEEILNEVSSLTAAAAAARAAADADVNAGTNGKEDAAVAAETARDDFQDLVDALVAADTDNDLVDAVDAAALAVETAQTDVDALAKLVTALETANANAAELKTLDDAITAAKAEFTAAGLKMPVTLGLAHAATSGSDIFVLGESASTSISGFGDAGVDHLFIGTDYTLSTSTKFDTTVGNNAVLEVFMIQSGANVKVYVEGVAFGSQSAAEAEQVITLTGVQLSELSFANGIITAA